MDLIIESSDNRQKISEIELQCVSELEKHGGKPYSAEKLKRDEFASQFMSAKIREKLLHVEGPAAHHKVLAAW